MKREKKEFTRFIENNDKNYVTEFVCAVKLWRWYKMCPWKMKLQTKTIDNVKIDSEKELFFKQNAKRERSQTQKV